MSFSRFRLDRATGSGFAETFSKELFVRLPDFFTDEAYARLRVEVLHLLESRRRKDFLMADTEYTPRHMSTVGGLEISRSSTIVPEMYADANLIEFLSGIAGEQVYTVADQNENHVINCLHELGDTHGAHVDTYAYAFNVFFDAPGLEGGGELEFVPFSTQLSDINSPAVRRVRNAAGDCYLFRTDRCVHRVAPLTQPGRRTILNLVYADAATKDLMSYSSSSLY